MTPISRLFLAIMSAFSFGPAYSETVDAPFSSASDVPVNVASFTAAGGEVHLSLLYDPTPGTELRVVNNSGVSPISGEFSNLAEGQRVVLPRGAKRYPFVASYKGGDGNDLVLVWARQAAEWLRLDTPTYAEESRGGIGSATGYLRGFRRAGGILADHTPVTFNANYLLSWALLADGTWATWNETDPPAALAMTGPLAGKKIRSLIGGKSHFLALCEDSSLIAWGKNDSGQIGNGIADQTDVEPVTISGTGALAGKTVVSIAAGYYHSLALCSDGSLAAWGNNLYGQLGTSDNIQHTVPTAVTMTGVLAGKTISRIYASDITSAVLCTDGKVYTWGYNTDGMLGNGEPGNVSQPVAVVTSGALAGKSVIDLSLDTYHALALCSDQSLVSWGRNLSGVLGDGTSTMSYAPVAVTGLDALGGERIVAISAGSDDQSFVLTAQGRVFGWGRGYGGNLGTATGNGGATPTLLSPYGDLAGSRVMQLPLWGGTSIVALPLKSDASLESLSLDLATLEQDIHPSRHQYLAALRSGATEVRLTPRTNDPDALVSVNGVPVTSGTSSLPIAVAPGGVPVTVSVTAQDGTTLDYTVGFVTSPTLNVSLLANAAPAISTPSYDATGGTASISLGHAPAAGSVFTLIENTGSNLIGGRFGNLAQGQILELPFNGLIYRFAVNYHGGTGNDLVLEWATRKLASWGPGSLGDGTSNTSLVPLEPDQSGALAGKSVSSVAVGLGHCLALCTDGTLVAWGKNDNGQLGNGSLVDSLIPVEVDRSGALAGRQIVAIRAGSYHSLALCSDGTVFSWGDNTSLQLGNGDDIDSPLPLAVPVNALFPRARVTSITTGTHHSGALFSNGRVVVWGDNQSNQLGASLVKGATLVTMGGPLATRTVTSLVAGSSHTYVQCSDGTIWGWGDNRSRGIVELVGPNVGQPEPVELTALASAANGPIRQLAGGNGFGLALDSAGKVFSWGNDQSSQLAQVSPAYSGFSRPVGEALITSLLAGDSVRSLVARQSTSAAITSSGKVIMWGDGILGKLGNGSNPFGGSAPVKVDTSGVLRDSPVMGLDVGSTVVAIAAIPPNTLLKSLAISPAIQDRPFSRDGLSYRLSVASGTTALNITAIPEYPYATVRINGSVADPSGFTLPVVPGLSQVDVEVGLEDGSTKTYAMELISDIHHTFDSPADIALSFPGYHAAGRSAHLSLGFEPRPGSALTVIENLGIGFIDGEFQNLAQWQNVTLSYNGKSHDFIVNYHGGNGNDLVLEWAHRELVLWGSDSFDALANGPAGNSNLPAAPTNPGALTGRTVLSVSAGQGHSVALCDGGEVVVWGTATAVQSATPKLLSGTGALAGRTVIAISAALNNAVALCADGSIVTWGSNTYGQLGNGTTTSSTSPVEVDRTGVLAGKTIVAISCGGSHCLALDSDGKVYSWGRGNRYQLGRSNTTANATTPIAVSTVSPSALRTRQVKAIATGLEHSLAICTDGSLVGWGSNTYGQLNNSGQNYPAVVQPNGALAGKTVVAISHGAENYTLALCSNGAVVGWGKNDLGQLGTSVVNYMTGPVAVVTTGVLSGKTVSSLSSGVASSLAICSDGTLVTWGNNSSGELGDGSNANHRPSVLPKSNGALYGRYGISGAASLHAMAVVAKPKDGYIDFISGFPGLTDQSDKGDSDGDGLSNLVEFVLGSDPTSRTNSHRPILVPGQAGSVFSFLRNPSSIGNTTQSFEWSDDLEIWNSTSIPATSAGDVIVGPAAGNGLQSIEVDLPDAPSGRRFGRIKVTRP